MLRACLEISAMMGNQGKSLRVLGKRLMRLEREDREDKDIPGGHTSPG